MSTRCRICLAAGLEAPAIQGLDVCQIHNVSGSTPASIQPQAIQDPLNTGLTHTFHAASTASNARPQTVFSSANMIDIPTPPGLHERGGWLTLQRLQDFVEQEILVHFDIVQPAQVIAGQAVRDLQLVPLSSWDAVSVVLKKLAYDPETTCPWSRLGIGCMEGPEPNEVAIHARAETARLICEHVSSLSWAASDLDRAAKAVAAFDDARSACLGQLPDVLRERRKLKTPKLPLWKELGHKASTLIRDTRTDAREHAFTQWSDLLGASSGQSQVSSARAAATLLEKGDGNFWGQLGSVPFVAWCPSDLNSLARVIATYVRGAQAQSRPAYFRLVAPLNLLPGMNSVGNVLDCWQHPLLGDKWASVVKDVSIHNLPLDMVLPGTNGPRHLLQGMVVFTLALQGARGLPKIVEIEEPLCPSHHVFA